MLILTLILLPETSGALVCKTGPGEHPLLAEKDIIQSIELLYDSKFNEAEELLNKVTHERPRDPKGYFYLAMVTWSRLAAGFWSPDVVKEYGKRIDRAIAVARKMIESQEADSFTYFYLGGALGFKGRFHLMERKWISSFFLALEAIDALKTCQKMDPANKDVLFGLGIFDYYTARLSGVIKFLSYLLLHKGNKEEGLKKLHIAANEAIYSATEAKSLLLHIYLFLECDSEKARVLARELALKYRNNPRHKFLEGVSYLRLGRESLFREVVAYMRERCVGWPSNGEASMWGNQAFYLEASHDLFHGRYEAARSKLDFILSNADPVLDPGMLAWPLLKKGMSHDIEGKREKALAYYRQILNMENGAGAQFLAEKYIDSPAGKNDPFLVY